jgi:putative ABC transport system permease protein
MKVLERKLVRDLWHMRGQVLAIVLVIVSGVGTFIMSRSTLDSLRMTRATYYRDYRFASVFASLKRAPESLMERIRNIPGVESAETRVVAEVKLDIEGFAEPVTGRLVSMPDSGSAILNRLHVREGRMIDPARADEVMVIDTFAKAHSLAPGDELSVIINGRLKELVIAGTALSPEYIFQISPGAIFPDFKRFGIFWMSRTALAAAYDMEGAFNDVAMSLSDGAGGAGLNDVIDRLDDILEAYGGLGAYGRADQISHNILSEEFRMLGNLAVIFPVIFLGVAAFLLNIVISRLVSTEREQIAVLKAFGYTNTALVLHYAKFVLAIVIAGVIGGVVAGIWLGKGLSGLYTEFYRFPFLNYELRPSVVAIAALVSMAAALAGTFSAVRRVAALSPAEGMRPEPPVSYRETFIERLGLKAFFSQPTRMIVRHIERRPVKSLMTVIGIALASAIMMVGNFQEDSIDYMVDVQFSMSQREDLSVGFVEPTSRGSLHELESLEGVLYGEPYRSVPARLIFEHRSYRTSIQGVEPGGDLQRILDSDLREIELPRSGVVLTDHLGKILGVGPGDMLTVEVLEGSRPVREVRVVALSKQYIGLWAYMDLSALNRLMREGDVISGVHLAVDERYREGIYSTIRGMPRVAAAIVRENSITNFYETMAETLLIFTSINMVLAATIAFGVVYNSARISLSERSRELASLRVLGFTRAEISYILLGELGVLTLAAIPLGFLIGRGLCAYIASSIESDLYRVPLILEPSTYSFAAVVVLVSAVVSGLIVRRKLDRLDLVAVLKTRE